MAQKPALDPASINSKVIDECMKLYPVVLDRVYRETHPERDVAEILEDDIWRYQKLPAVLSSGGDLSKAQLARLVRWKITHGKYRPFLPGMIQKNTEAEVKAASIKAAQLLRDLSTQKSDDGIIKIIEAALAEICILKGVGPATGTLVLSVYNPAVVPFFEDELFHWLASEHPAKLKYDKKEYKVVLEEVLKIISVHGFEARTLEKVAYVVQHSKVLNDIETKRLIMLSRVTHEAGSDCSMDDASQTKSEEQAIDGIKVKPARAKRSQPDELMDPAANPAGTRRSKRTRK